MKEMKRVLSLVLTLAMVLSMSVPMAFAAEQEPAYSDIAGHWAEKPIERWDEYGIVSGFGEEFRPNGTITRGQMASILSNLLNLTEEADNTFSDVPEGKWYTTFVLRCVDAGIMAGSNGKAMPEKEITRQEAMTMLCQALGIEPNADADLSGYTDVDQLARWAKPFVGTMVEAGIVSGVSADKLGGTASMSRGAVMTILDKAVAQYINAEGTYELTDKEGIVLIAAENVILTGETKAEIMISASVNPMTVVREEVEMAGGGGGASGGSSGGSSKPSVKDLTVKEEKTVTGGTYASVTIADTVGDGTVTLDGLTINGDLTINGGGSGTINVKNSTIKGKIIVNKDGGETPRVHLHETPVDYIVAEKPVIIEAADDKSPVEKIEAKNKVTVQGEQTVVETMEIPFNVEPVEIDMKAGKVEEIHAKGEAVINGAEGIVDTVIVEAPVAVDSNVVSKVEVPETMTTSAAITVGGSGAVEVEVNTEHGAQISAPEADVEISTSLDEAPEIVVNEEVLAHVHKMNSGVVTKEPTCTEKGVKTYSCVNVGCEPLLTKTEEIAALGHKEVVDKAVAATCTETGLTEGKHCSVCVTVLVKQEVVAALGHKEVVDKAVAATCTETGLTEGKHCSVCETVLVKQEVVAALGHKEVVDKAVAATCTETGLTEGKHCSVCEEVLVKQNVVPVLGHDMTEEHYDVNGHWMECTRCDEVGEAVAHEYAVNDCTKEEKCSDCDYVKPAGEHNWDGGKKTTAPTCTETGVMTYTCTAKNCGKTKTEEIAALGHSWDKGVVVEGPTVREDGTRLYTCGTCSETKEESIPKIELMGKNGYDLNVYVGQDLFTEVTAPADADPDTRYVFKFYNSYNTNHYDAWGDRKADATYGLPSHPGTYDVLQVSIYDGDFEDNEVVAEFILDKEIVVKEDAFELTDGSITITRTPDEDDASRAWYDIEGLDFSKYGYYFASTEDDYASPMGNPPLGLSADYADDTMVIYAAYAVEEDDCYLKEMSKALKVTIVDVELEPEEDEDQELIDAANDINLLKYMTEDVELDETVSRLEVARLIASLDSLRLPSEVSLDFTDISDLSEQDKKIIWANVDAEYLVGYSDGRFDPSGMVTRAQVAVILQRIYEVNGMDYSVGALDDVVPGNWYYEDVMNMYNLGIIQLEGTAFEPNSPAMMRDVLEWLINAREWDETAHDLGGVTDWQMVSSQYVHAKVCVDCGLWVEKEEHSWDNGVVSSDGTQITKTCTVCGFAWTMDVPAGIESTGDYPVSNLHFDGNVLVWDAPDGISGEVQYVIELSVDGEDWNDVGETDETEEQIRYEGEGSYYIRIVTLEYDSESDEYNEVGSYADYSLKLNITEGNELEKAQVKFQCLGAEDGHKHSITVSGIPADVDFHLNTYIPEGDCSGWYGGTDENGSDSATLGNRHLHDIITSEDGYYQMFTFYDYSLSDDGTTMSYVYDYTEEAKCADVVTEYEELTGIETDGDYPVSNLHFEGQFLKWDAPTNVPDGVSVKYRVYTSSDNGANWELFSGTSQTLINMCWAEPGTHKVRVATRIDGIENGWITDYDCNIVISSGDRIEDAAVTFEYLRTENEQDFYKISASGLAKNATYWIGMETEDADCGFGGTTDADGNISSESGASDLKAIVENGYYSIFVYPEFTVSEDGKTLSFAFDYTGEVKCTAE